MLLLAAALVGGIAATWSGESIGSWVFATALAGVLLFVTGVALTLRELLNGVWKIVKDSGRQRARLAAAEGSLSTLRRDSDVHADVILSQVAAVKEQVAGIDKDVAKLHKRQEVLAKSVKESDRSVRHLASLIDRVKARQQDQGRLLSEMSGQVKQVGSRQQKVVRPALARIEADHEDKIKPALRNIEREQLFGYRQLEAYSGIIGTLGLRSPLPPLRKTWAIDPDSATLLIRLVLAEGPQTIVELGSGISTVLIGKALTLGGSGRLRSLDHDAYFLAETMKMLEAESLEGAVDLLEAPLEDTEIDDVVWKWYSPVGLEGLDTVDLVIVDGPPSSTGPEARYPAVPMLASRMRNGSIVFLDDANREDEAHIVERWLAEYPLVELQVPKTEKGAALLQWRA